MSNESLRVACAHCHSKFQVADQLVRGKVVKFRCKKCRGTIEVDGRALARVRPPPPPARHADGSTAPARISTPVIATLPESVLVPDEPEPDSTPSPPSEPPEQLFLSDGVDGGSLAPPPHLRPPSVPPFSDAEAGTLAPLLTAPPTSMSSPPPDLGFFDPRLAEPSLALATAPSRRRPGAVIAGVALVLLAGSAAAVLSTRPTPSAEPSPAAQSSALAAMPRGIRPSDFQGVTAEPPVAATTRREAPSTPTPPSAPTPPATPGSSAAAAEPRAVQPNELPPEPAPPPRRGAGAAARTDAPLARDTRPLAQAADDPAAAATVAPALAHGDPAPPAPNAGGGDPNVPEPSEGPEFDTGAARAAMEEAAIGAAACKETDTPSGPARLAVTFAPTGRVTTAEVESGPFVGTAVGGCIAAKFRGAHVPAFGGAEAVTVHKTVSF